MDIRSIAKRRLAGKAGLILESGDGGRCPAGYGRGLLLLLPGDELRPHRALAAPVWDTSDGTDVFLSDGTASH